MLSLDLALSCKGKLWDWVSIAYLLWNICVLQKSFHTETLVCLFSPPPPLKEQNKEWSLQGNKLLERSLQGNKLLNIVKLKAFAVQKVSLYLAHQLLIGSDRCL